jgi:hypothetical protein
MDRVSRKQIYTLDYNCCQVIYHYPQKQILHRIRPNTICAWTKDERYHEWGRKGSRQANRMTPAVPASAFPQASPTTQGIPIHGGKCAINKERHA